MKNLKETLTHTFEQITSNFVENRKKRKQAFEQEREARLKLEDERRTQGLRESVSGPDTVDAVMVWKEVMGKKPMDGISQIYALKSQGWSNEFCLSFVYRDKNALIDALGETEFGVALDLLDRGFDNDYPCSMPPPKWGGYWPFRPGVRSKKGGRPNSRPFMSDSFYYYLDSTKRRFFLATATTNSELQAEIQAKLERSQEFFRKSPNQD